MQNIELSDRLKKLRMTSAHFADQCGLAKVTIDAWRCGRAPIPAWVPVVIESIEIIRAEKARQKRIATRKRG